MKWDEIEKLIKFPMMTDIKFKPSYNNMCNQEHVMHYESGSSSCYFVVATIDNRVHYKLFISMCRRVMYIVYII